MSKGPGRSSIKSTCPYLGWDLYFHGCKPEEYQNLYAGIEGWIKFFSSKYSQPAVQVFIYPFNLKKIIKNYFYFYFLIILDYI